MQELVSIIVPVYNVEKYVKECVMSIIGQTYDNIEIILVDDGSTDGSGRLCDDLAGVDSRITVIHQSNGGLSSARNAGIIASSGEYLCFIDSDDVIKKEYVSALVAGCSTGCKMAVCNIERFTDGEKYCLESDGERSNGHVVPDYSFVTGLSDLISEEYVKCVIAMNKMYHRSLFDKVTYPIGRIHEDEFVIYKLAMLAEQIYVTEETLYLYRQRDNSITGSTNKLNFDHYDVIDAYETRIMQALEYADVEMAEITTRNCLIKLIQFAGQFKKSRELVNIVRKRYLMVYYKYGYIMSRKRRMKYRLMIHIM